MRSAHVGVPRQLSAHAFELFRDFLGSPYVGTGMNGNALVSHHDEVRLTAHRAKWRALFVHTDGTQRSVEGVTHDAASAGAAGAAIGREAGLGSGWRLHIVELLDELDAEFAAPIPEHTVVADGDLAEIWVGGNHAGSLCGTADDGWLAFASLTSDRNGPFEEGFYPSRSTAAAAVAAGLLNGSRG